jgi:hypothetical protein
MPRAGVYRSPWQDFSDVIIAGDVNGYLFRTAAGKTGMLKQKALSQPDAYRMVQRQRRHGLATA